MALTTQCPTCGNLKNPNAKQCHPCANTARSQKLTGVKHSKERRKANSEGQKARTDDQRFDIAAHMRERPHPFALDPGTERVVKDGRVIVKCDDGKWRYRSRLVYAAAHGPLLSQEIIHHINFNPMDDRLENLQNVTRSEHARIHMEARLNGSHPGSRAQWSQAHR